MTLECPLHRRSWPSYVRAQWIQPGLMMAVTLLILLLGSIIFVKIGHTAAGVAHDSRRLSDSILKSSALMELESVKRILYIVTSGNEFKGERSSLAHLPKDRLMNLVVPVMKDSIESMIGATFEVDIYLILGYTLRPQRENLLRLEFGISNIEIWDDAVPLNYNYEFVRIWKQEQVKISPISRALSRQYCFVVRDELFEYDVFAAFENDMHVTGTHIKHHLGMSQEIEALKERAPVVISQEGFATVNEDGWFGAMPGQELARIRPGFIRVEVLPGGNAKKQFALENVPVDLNYTCSNDVRGAVDPSICCHVNRIRDNGAPSRPEASQLIVWETAISGIEVGELPDGSWVGVLNGPEESIGMFEAAASRNLTDQRQGNHPQLYAQPGS
jgi:hypothetical protein